MSNVKNLRKLCQKYTPVISEFESCPRLLGFIVVGAHTNILFVIKVKILVLGMWSYKVGVLILLDTESIMVSMC